MTTNQKIVVVSCLGIGLIGLGALGYFLLKEQTPSPAPEGEAKPKQKPKKSKPETAKALTEGFIEDYTISPPETKAEVPEALLLTTKEKPLEYTNDQFPLKLGSKGKNVERLKVWLQRNFGTFGVINDKFDKQLEEIVEKRFGKLQVTKVDFSKRRMGNPIHKQTHLK